MGIQNPKKPVPFIEERIGNHSFSGWSSILHFVVSTDSTDVHLNGIMKCKKHAVNAGQNYIFCANFVHKNEIDLEK